MFDVTLWVALAIIVALLFGLHRVHRALRGRAPAAPLVSRGIGRARKEGPNDLERFISDYRAQQGSALAAPLLDAAPDHQLGIDLKQAAATPVFSGAGRLLYLLLKTTLREYHVLPNAQLGDFLGNLPAGQGAHRVDFLICNRAFDPVCALDLTHGHQSIARAKDNAQRLAATGIRHVSIASTALPKRDRIRGVVLGS